MAGKKTKKGEVGDDFDLSDLDDLDSDMSFDDIEDDRDPSKTGIAKELGKEAATGFLDGLVSKTVKKSLPEEYEYNASEVMEYVDFGKEIVEKNKSRIEQTLGKLGTEVKKILPFQSKLLDNFLEQHAEKNAKAQQESEEAMRDAGIQSNLASVFDKQLELQKAIEVRNEAKGQVEAKERLASTRMTTNLLSSIDSNMAQQSAFTTQIGKEYYKKSLELQYKSYFIQADMLKTMRDYYKGFSVQFDSIVKNTGLPEYVKLTNAERAGELIRNKAMDTVYKQVFSNSKYLDGVKKRVDGLISSKVEDALSGVDAFTDQLDMLNSAADGPSGVARLLAGVFSGMGGSSLGEKLADKISPKIKDQIKDNQGINAGGKYLDMLVNSPSTFFSIMKEKADKQQQKYSGENTPGEMLGSKVFGGLSGLLNVTSPEAMEYKVKSESALSHKAPAIFDNKVHRSITEVIPMYLASILKQNTDLTKMYTEVNAKRLGTNFPGSDQLHYDYEGRKLVTESVLKDNIESKVLSNTGTKARSKSLSTSIVRQGKTNLGKDKKANAKELKLLESKEASSMLENYFFKASKLQGVNKNYQTLIADATDPTKAPAELNKLLEGNDKLKELLEVLKKAQGTESTDGLDRGLSDLGTTYPTAALRKLFSDTSKLAGSKILNTLSDTNAQTLARGFTRHVLDTGKDITPSTVLDGKAFRNLTKAEFESLQKNLIVFTAEVKRILDSGGIVSEGSLGVLFGLLNKSLRESIDINPEVFQTLYDLNPVLGSKGKLTTENLMDRKLGNFEKQDYVELTDLKSVTKVLKVKTEEARADIFSVFTESSVFKGATEFKSDLTAAGKNPKLIFAAVTKHAKKVGDSVSAASKEYYDKASVRFGEMEKLATKLATEKTDEAAKATLSLMVSKMSSLEVSISNLIATEKNTLTEKEKALSEMKSKLIEAGNDPATEKSIERELKLAKAYHTDKIKLLESIKSTLSNQHVKLRDLQQSNEGKSVVDIVKEVRDILQANMSKLKDLVEKAKEVENRATETEVD